MLERKFIGTLSYVELAEDNYKTYSSEYAALLQSAGAELDLLFKVSCGMPASERHCINDYAKHILDNYPEVKEQEVEAKTYGVSFKPFCSWSKSCPGESLKWWKAFTNIKHNRTENMNKASLENVMHIIGALCFLEMKYLLLITDKTDEINVPDEESAIFTLKDWPRNFVNNVGCTVARTESGRECIVINGGTASN